MKKLAILVSGGGTNMEAILQACQNGILSGQIEPAVVVSNKPGVGAIERATRLGVPVEVLPHGRYSSRGEHEQAILDVLATHGTELVVLAGYMRILTPVFLQGAPGPVLNIHPVPTHLYQGAAGYEDSWNRRTEFQVNFPTVHLVDPGVDTGRVVLYGLPYRVDEAQTLDELRARGLTEEHLVYPEAIHHLLAMPTVQHHDPEHSTAELAGVSQLGIDLLGAAAEARKHRDGRIGCMAQRDWQGTGYRIQAEGQNVDAEAHVGWLAGSERITFTRLMTELLMLARKVPIEFLYEGLRIDLQDSRPASPPAAGSSH